ncbi:helix-turn-helix domain-containing protein [Halobacillus seohaensis]|uniref:Helix-turn-helix domain-containing protein n=1 Tax=Halobacillus seohaensis TaxID=447421 RepID=A0ABW2ESL4_9BACI
MEKIIEIKLRSLLKEKQMGQKELANKTNLTERTISELANGKTRRLPKEALEKIASVLELESINELLTLKDKE